jgi:methylated-DNA-[protein]-cysteine S-methyltransferase
MAFSYKYAASPLGDLKVIASERGLAAILWPNENPKRVRLGELIENVRHPVLRQTEEQLREYFAGTRTRFTVPLDLIGTDFQKKVWTALLGIPFGETRTYGELATQIGQPTAARAVGAANGKNPISIITPCHRAIGSDGSLTGFAGGLEAKLYLLTLERNQATATVA